jgi:hypothetical protein
MAACLVFLQVNVGLGRVFSMEWKSALVARKYLCLPKSEGGLGLLDKARNKSLVSMVFFSRIISFHIHICYLCQENNCKYLCNHSVISFL